MKLYALVLFLISTGLLAACGLSTKTPTPLPPTATPVPYPLAVTSVEDELDALQSYRAHTTVDFTGTRQDEVLQGRIETITETSQQPSALHAVFNLDGDFSQAKIPAGRSEFYRVDDTVYVKKADALHWSQFAGPTTMPAQLDFPTPEELLTLPLTVSTPPVTETLHNVSARHYVFDESELSHPAMIFDKAQGEVWLNAADGYVMQYVISASVRVTLPNPHIDLFDQGHLSLSYTLTDVNADLVITPPADALTMPVTFNDLPRLPDAEIISVLPNFVAYLSATPPISATQFYQAELIAQEWSQTDIEAFEEKARLTFAKNGQTLTLVILPAEEKDKIKVVLEMNDRGVE